MYFVRMLIVINLGAHVIAGFMVLTVYSFQIPSSSIHVWVIQYQPTVGPEMQSSRVLGTPSIHSPNPSNSPWIFGPPLAISNSYHGTSVSVIKANQWTGNSPGGDPSTFCCTSHKDSR